MTVLSCYHYLQFVSTLGFFAGECVLHGLGDTFPLLALACTVALSVVVMTVLICYHYPLLSTFLSWVIPFADDVCPWPDTMLPLLVFALACLGSLEWVAEVVLALEWVSQFLCQWSVQAGQSLVNLQQVITDKIN